jgi:hypothetical protein
VLRKLSFLRFSTFFQQSQQNKNRPVWAPTCFCPKNTQNFGLVPLTGLEPVRYCYRGILSPMCLPIPPQRRLLAYHTAVWRRRQYAPPSDRQVFSAKIYRDYLEHTAPNKPIRPPFLNNYVTL